MLHAPPYPFRVQRGFETLQHHWDHAAQAWIVQIKPGDYYVTSGSEIISTVLGSCVSTCIRDPASGWGGMNHFMLPEDPSADASGKSLRFGCFAVERVINELVKRGARRDALEVKVFGGGQVIAGMSDVGMSNVKFVREYLQAEGIPLTVEDVGGRVARRLRYYATTGKVLVKHLAVRDAAAVVAKERDFRQRLKDGSVSGDVELF